MFLAPDPGFHTPISSKVSVLWDPHWSLDQWLEDGHLRRAVSLDARKMRMGQKQAEPRAEIKETHNQTTQVLPIFF